MPPSGAGPPAAAPDAAEGSSTGQRRSRTTSSAPIRASSAVRPDRAAKTPRSSGLLKIGEGRPSACHLEDTSKRRLKTRSLSLAARPSRSVEVCWFPSRLRYFSAVPGHAWPRSSALEHQVHPEVAGRDLPADRWSYPLPGRYRPSAEWPGFLRSKPRLPARCWSRKAGVERILHPGSVPGVALSAWIWFGWRMATAVTTPCAVDVR